MENLQYMYIRLSFKIGKKWNISWSNKWNNKIPFHGIKLQTYLSLTHARTHTHTKYIL